MLRIHNYQYIFFKKQEILFISIDNLKKHMYFYQNKK